MVEGRAAIDALRGPDGALDRAAVRRVLPYGDAFLFVDRVTELTDEAMVGHYRVPERSDWLDAHFEGFPVVPGVILGEGFGQAASLLVRYRVEPGVEREVVGFRTRGALFVRPVFPAQEITYRVRLEEIGAESAHVRGRVFREAATVARFDLVLGIVDRRDFRRQRDA